MTTKPNVIGRIKAALSGGTPTTAAEYTELLEAAALEQAALRAEHTGLTDAMMIDDTVIPRRQQIAGQIEAMGMRLAALQSAQKRAIIGEVEAALMVEIDQQMARRRERVELLRQLEALDAQRAALDVQIRQLNFARWDTPPLRFRQMLKASGIASETMRQDMGAAQERLNTYFQQQQAMLSESAEGIQE